MSVLQASIEAITYGPRFHWFGYYDKYQFDPSGRFVLGMEVDFEHRSPTAADVISVGMVDLQNKNEWIELGHSRAWCWQQGCMLQWLPGSETEIIWNDRQGGDFVCHILDICTGKKKTLPFPIYTISPDGKTAFCNDYRRVNEMRPGYGYIGISDPNRDILAPNDSGIWSVDLETGEVKLILSIGEIASLSYPHADISKAKHYFNHLLICPDGSRLEFLHRWRFPKSDRWSTRMLTCAPDGSDVRVVDDCGVTSHFIWHNPKEIFAWTLAHSKNGSFCVFDEHTGSFKPIGEKIMVEDGHINCLSNSRWLLNDTYPNEEKIRSLYLYHIPSSRRVEVGKFYSPSEYAGEYRCDLHPSLSRNGRQVVVDSVHEGNGRQMYLINIGDIVS